MSSMCIQLLYQLSAQVTTVTVNSHLRELGLLCLLRLHSSYTRTWNRFSELIGLYFSFVLCQSSVLITCSIEAGYGLCTCMSYHTVYVIFLFVVEVFDVHRAAD